MVVWRSVLSPGQHHHSAGGDHGHPRGPGHGEDQWEAAEPPPGVLPPEEDRAAAEDLQDHLRLHGHQQSRSQLVQNQNQNLLYCLSFYKYGMCFCEIGA